MKYWTLNSTIFSPVFFKKRTDVFHVSFTLEVSSSFENFIMLSIDIICLAYVGVVQVQHLFLIEWKIVSKLTGALKTW